jgi:hypothetical protein
MGVYRYQSDPQVIYVLLSSLFEKHWRNLFLFDPLLTKVVFELLFSLAESLNSRRHSQIWRPKDERTWHLQVESLVLEHDFRQSGNYRAVWSIGVKS